MWAGDHFHFTTLFETKLSKIRKAVRNSTKQGIIKFEAEAFEVMLADNTL